MREFDYIHLEQDLFTADIVALLTAIHEHKGKQELFIETEPYILQSMMEIARVQSTGASNRIEGIYTSDERLEKLVRFKAEPRNRSEAEIAGYREVLNTIHEAYDHIGLTPNIILQLHRDLYAYNVSVRAGQWKNTDNVITETEPDGTSRVRFVPVPAFDTADAMNRLCTAFNEALKKGKYDPLLLIAMFILDFLCIHPFNDGNGRLSRLLTLLLLYRAGYLVGKYVSLEIIIESSKEEYYEALLVSSQNWHAASNSYRAFISYYLGVLQIAYREFSERVSHLRHRRVSKPERIRLLFDKNLASLNKKEIMGRCPDISMATVEKTLGEMVKEGYIIKTGAGKKTAYIRIRAD